MTLAKWEESVKVAKIKLGLDPKKFTKCRVNCSRRLRLFIVFYS